MVGEMFSAVRDSIDEMLAADECPMFPDSGEEIDVCVSGGGVRGYYLNGAWVGLRRLLEQKDIKVARFAGASAGSWVSMFMAVGMHELDWLDTYYETIAKAYDTEGESTGKRLLDAYTGTSERPRAARRAPPTTRREPPAAPPSDPAPPPRRALRDDDAAHAAGRCLPALLRALLHLHLRGPERLPGEHDNLGIHLQRGPPGVLHGLLEHPVSDS
jgi:hypothetical protein